MPQALTQLHRLARRCGVQTAYYDISGNRRAASPESLLGTLKSLRVPVSGLDDVDEALKKRRQDDAARGVPPVAVAWNGGPATIGLRLPAKNPGGLIKLQLELEDGKTIEKSVALDRSAATVPREIDRTGFVEQQIEIPGGLAHGYHRLSIETRDRRFFARVISVPKKAYSPRRGSPLRDAWGCFLPLYSLKTKQSLGAGHFGDLQKLAGWVGEMGGGLLGTLPLMPAYLDRPCDPSPYSPVSRNFWNEFYIDLAAVPELAECEPARRLLESTAVRDDLARIDLAKLIQYRDIMAVKRSVLEKLAEHFFKNKPASRFGELEEYRRAVPQAENYAAFRATYEQRGTWWKEWPANQRMGMLKEGDYDQAAWRYYLYAQWIAAQQIEGVAAKSREAGVEIYLDLPLGVRTDGYDVWRNQAAFADGASAGAPPDVIFTKGQDWGFSPLHPQALREQHYQPLIDCLRHHLKVARMLRIDHVMGLHRLYWIPWGLSAQEGCYVRYYPEELYAVLNLESHRHQAVIVGENLGTVPKEVNRAIRRHGVRTMHVVQYELESQDSSPAAGRGQVASLNTHDMPMFASWWRGKDIDLRRELNLIEEREIEPERKTRRRQKESLLRRLKSALPKGGLPAGLAGKEDDESLLAVLKAALVELSASETDVVLVNLEDLWQETRRQNVPGTWMEQPNWRRPAKYTFEKFSKMARVVETLAAVNAARRGD